LLVELDGRLELDSGIFFLTLEEVSHLKEESYLDQALDLIDRRRVRAEAWKSLQLPSELSVENIEALEFEGNTIAGVIRQAGDVLRGTRVSGETEVVGRVRVIHDPDEVDSFCRGEVLVARFTDPTWTPLFPLVGGVITEVGGWLSHAAIVAREYQIPAIVGARGAMEILGTGDLVRLRLDGTIEKVATNRRRHQRVPVSARVALLRQGELVGALLRDLSVSGALIEVDEDLKEGQGVHIRISADREEVRAEVVRRDPSGGYALEFKTPLAGPLPALPLEGGPGKN
jgi:phosphohistidine swiveling domain-containing protein